MRISTRQLLGSLLLLALVASCSRPIAYFQPSLREHLVGVSSQGANPSPENQIPITVSGHDQSLVMTDPLLGKVEPADVLVSTTDKLATAKINHRRTHTMHAMLVSTAGETSAGTTKVAAPRKMTFVERLMVKKLNARIKRQLAPANPEKTWASKSVLVIGAVLLLGGISLLAFTTGGGFALGAIAFAAGLVLLLVELL